MPPANSASARSQTARASAPPGTAAPRTAAARRAAAEDRRRAQVRRTQRPQRVRVRSPHLRVRWERVGRIALLVVLAVVIGLYVEHGLSYFSAQRASARQQAIVDHLERQNAYFERREQSLNNLQTILTQARRLGMVRPGEQPYAVVGQSH